MSIWRIKVLNQNEKKKSLYRLEMMEKLKRLQEGEDADEVLVDEISSNENEPSIEDVISELLSPTSISNTEKTKDSNTEQLEQIHPDIPSPQGMVLHI